MIFFFSVSQLCLIEQDCVQGAGWWSWGFFLMTMKLSLTAFNDFVCLTCFSISHVMYQKKWVFSSKKGHVKKQSLIPVFNLFIYAREQTKSPVPKTELLKHWKYLFLWVRRRNSSLCATQLFLMISHFFGGIWAWCLWMGEGFGIPPEAERRCYKINPAFPFAPVTAAQQPREQPDTTSVHQLTPGERAGGFGEPGEPREDRASRSERELQAVRAQPGERQVAGAQPHAPLGARRGRGHQQGRWPQRGLVCCVPERGGPAVLWEVPQGVPPHLPRAHTAQLPQVPLCCAGVGKSEVRFPGKIEKV